MNKRTDKCRDKSGDKKKDKAKQFSVRRFFCRIGKHRDIFEKDFEAEEFLPTNSIISLAPFSF